MPTDQRYIDLTEEQIELIYEHYLLDNPPKNASYDDPDYDKQESEHVEDTGKQEDNSSRLPIQDHERYEDPDFDDEWNTDGEVSDNESISENPSNQSSGINEEGSEPDIKNDSGTDEWEVL